MQLDVMTLAPGGLYVLVPQVSMLTETVMFVLQTAESNLLHDVGKECGAGTELFVDCQQASQRRELNFFNVARAVPPQFPVVSKREIDCWKHTLLSRIQPQVVTDKDG